MVLFTATYGRKACLACMFSLALRTRTACGNVINELLLRPFEEDVFPRCELSCSNGGYCSYTFRNEDELAASFQSGEMIQRCVCQPGFTGTACEIEEEQCSSPDRLCHNGMPCTYNTLINDWSCECALAAQLSPFAADMCKKPYTEYCADRYNKEDETLSFCTNGGKCKSGLIAAKVAPRNTTINLIYQHEGCVCPPEFYGPHCEFLHLDLLAIEDHLLVSKEESETENNEDTKDSDTEDEEDSDTEVEEDSDKEVEENSDIEAEEDEEPNVDSSSTGDGASYLEEIMKGISNSVNVPNQGSNNEVQDNDWPERADDKDVSSNGSDQEDTDKIEEEPDVEKSSSSSNNFQDIISSPFFIVGASIVGSALAMAIIIFFFFFRQDFYNRVRRAELKDTVSRSMAASSPTTNDLSRSPYLEDSNRADNRSRRNNDNMMEHTEIATDEDAMSSKSNLTMDALAFIDQASEGNDLETQSREKKVRMSDSAFSGSNASLRNEGRGTEANPAKQEKGNSDSSSGPKVVYVMQDTATATSASTLTEIDLLSMPINDLIELNKEVSGAKATSGAGSGAFWDIL